MFHFVKSRPALEGAWVSHTARRVEGGFALIRKIFIPSRLPESGNLVYQNGQPLGNTTETVVKIFPTWEEARDAANAADKA